MALFVCKECNGTVSDTAAACPHCGAPVPKPVVPGATKSKLLAAGDMACAMCEKHIPKDAIACAFCGHPVPAGAVALAAFKQSSNWWMWVLGVPIGLFVVFIIFGAMQPASPERDKAREIYRACISKLSDLDRGRSSGANFMASMCENMRQDFIQKYGREP
jgi:RNA polymerase subunit RPABC4/transcription elongation factor Spt4